MDSGRVISVFCSSDARATSAAYARALRVGQVLGESGFAVATGGYGGAMEAVSRGAAEAGAEVIGVTCRIWSGAANAHVSRVIETGDYYERLRTLVEIATAGYVALGGGTGTLVELALVWELAAKGLFPDRPIVCLGDFWRPLPELISAARPAAADSLRFIDSPEALPGCFDRGTDRAGGSSGRS
ncbi:hypothetical protein LCGC14_2161230 [marine sediment metagenome]|uniref:DNA-binding protein n=1 Tax=marine sediment metagenome TaxID=412755 RepID=A0A0F9GNW1_9ZZZZ